MSLANNPIIPHSTAPATSPNANGATKSLRSDPRTIGIARISIASKVVRVRLAPAQDGLTRSIPDIALRGMRMHAQRVHSHMDTVAAHALAGLLTSLAAADLAVSRTA